MTKYPTYFFVKKGNVDNVLLVFELEEFKFSLSWSLCFWQQPPLIFLCSMLIENKLFINRYFKKYSTNKRVFSGKKGKPTHSYSYFIIANVRLHFPLRLQSVLFRPSSGDFPNTQLPKDVKDGGRGNFSGDFQSFPTFNTFPRVAMHSVFNSKSLRRVGKTWFSTQAFSLHRVYGKESFLIIPWGPEPIRKGGLAMLQLQSFNNFKTGFLLLEKRKENDLRYYVVF